MNIMKTYIFLPLLEHSIACRNSQCISKVCKIILNALIIKSVQQEFACLQYYLLPFIDPTDNWIIFFCFPGKKASQ